ncbi:organic cation transporter-like protein [Lytechinus variegatus]|uniref:organic cation transporter-like protein n=1 Tax=Lytechinus variegatus TaxID=7654 RepID=UPI001BB2C6B1|nr:organic cation transporter-like protein [Lytechinus variegatus]
MAFDDILLTLGEFGTYQKITYALVFLFWFPAAANVLAVVFLAGPADHWCRVPEWDDANCSGMGLDESDCAYYKKHLSIPHTVADDDTILYDQCRKYDVSQVSFADAMTYFKEGTNQSENIYDVINCDQGWMHDMALSTYTFIQTFDLVCDRKYLVNLSQSIFFVGVFIGSVILGAIADRYGRKITLIISNIIVVLFGVCAAFSPNYITLVTLRALSAVGCFGMLLISTVIGTEFVGPSKRAFVGIFISVSFSLGYLLLTIYAYFIRNWRYLLLSLNLTFALFFFFYPFIPESVRWQISKGRYKEAEATIRKVARINKVNLPDAFFHKHDFYNSGEKQAEKERDPTLLDLFRTPVLRKRTLVLIVIWLTNNLIFYGLHLSTGSFGVNIYLSFVISGVVEIVSVCLCIPAIEWIGRLKSIIACFVIAGVASFIAIFVPTGVAKTTIGMIGKFGIAGSWAIGGIIVLEVLPTPTRSVGIGICSTASRIIAVATPLLLILYDVWAPGPLVLQTIAALITAGLCFILPETRGKKLPETLEDGETFGIKTQNEKELYSMQSAPL